MGRVTTPKVFEIPTYLHIECEEVSLKHLLTKLQRERVLEKQVKAFPSRLSTQLDSLSLFLLSVLSPLQQSMDTETATIDCITAIKAFSSGQQNHHG